MNPHQFTLVSPRFLSLALFAFFAFFALPTVGFFFHSVLLFWVMADMCPLRHNLSFVFVGKIMSGARVNSIVKGLQGNSYTASSFRMINVQKVVYCQFNFHIVVQHEITGADKGHACISLFFFFFFFNAAISRSWDNYFIISRWKSNFLVIAGYFILQSWAKTNTAFSRKQHHL